MFRRPEPPTATELSVTVQYRFGILRMGVGLAGDSAPVWLWRATLGLERSDGASDEFAFDIGAPIRLNPSGSIVDHWRPDAMDLEDPAFERPSISVALEVSRKRGVPIHVSPSVDIDDGFKRSVDRYILLPGTPFAAELAEQRTTRLDGLVAREG